MTETSPQVRLARRSPRNVRSAGSEQTARVPGDVLVLVRQRGPLFEAIIRALKDAGIAVAGADRLVLTEHIAVMDLMALADALLLPDDDLALATVLKSPLFGLDDDELFALAWQRKGIAARRACAPRRTSRASPTRPHSSIASPSGRGARRRSPSTRACSAPEGGRKRFLARLGPEADDALDEFLNLALDYERRETPSLQGFVAWLRAAQTEVKRDMEIARDEVRVMTVHGAKGLEAPIVILADTTTPPAGPPQRQPRLLTLAGRGRARHAGPPRLGRPQGRRRRAGRARRASARAREAEDEYRRLLYVAMTRAADRLIVCGCDGEREPAGGLLVRPRARRARAGRGRGTGRRRRRHGAGASQDDRRPASCGSRRAQPARSAAKRRPTGSTRDAPARAATVAPLSPSRAYDETERWCARAGSRRRPREGARARHARAPAAAVAAGHRRRSARAEAARRYLARDGADFDADERERDRRAGRCALLDDAALRGAVRAGQPRRGADRRPRSRTGPHRRGRRPGRPARGHRRARC